MITLLSIKTTRMLCTFKELFQAVSFQFAIPKVELPVVWQLSGLHQKKHLLLGQA